MMTSDRPGWMAPGRSQVSTFIVVPDAMRVVSFAEAVFGAELRRPPLCRGSGALWNAEMTIGGCTIMLGDASEGMHRPAFLYIHVADVEATFDRALSAGAAVVMEPQSQFYGDFDGGVEDPAGNWWWIARHERDLTAAEIEAGARALEEA